MPVGRIFKPHGYKGEMNADIFYGPELFSDPETPFFVKIDNILVPFFVESIGGGTEGTSFLKLKGIDSDLEALTFNRKDLYALKSFVSSLFGVTEEELQLAAEDFRGYEVCDSYDRETIGVVEGVEEGVEYDYLEVRREDGETLYIPFIDEFVESVVESSEGTDTPEKRGKIYVNLPDGFLEI